MGYQERAPSFVAHRSVPSDTNAFRASTTVSFTWLWLSGSLTSGAASGFHVLPPSVVASSFGQRFPPPHGVYPRTAPCRSEIQLVEDGKNPSWSAVAGVVRTRRPASVASTARIFTLCGRLTTHRGCVEVDQVR